MGATTTQLAKVFYHSIRKVTNRISKVGKFRHCTNQITWRSEEGKTLARVEQVSGRGAVEEECWVWGEEEEHWVRAVEKE